MTVDTEYGEFPDSFAKYVRPTHLVNSDHSFIKKQSNELTKDCKTLYQAVKAIHAYVASLPMGYDREDKPASYIFRKQRGQCNTKTTLFMALARAAGIPTRVHAWHVHKFVYKHHMPTLVYMFTPKTTLFTYPEVYYKDKWQLLSAVLTRKHNPDWEMCPFDNGAHRKKPLREDMIAEDHGSYWNPDMVYGKFGTNADGWRKLAFPIAQLLLNRTQAEKQPE